MLFVCYPKCTTCQKAKAWLEARGLPAEVRDIKTQNPTEAELRRRLEHTFFLVPGYGAQGGTAADVRCAFDELGRGAIVNASRSIMCAWKKTGKDGMDYQEAARAAAEQMRDELREYITIL